MVSEEELSVDARIRAMRRLGIINRDASKQILLDSGLRHLKDKTMSALEAGRYIDLCKIFEADGISRTKLIKIAKFDNDEEIEYNKAFTAIPVRQIDLTLLLVTPNPEFNEILSTSLDNSEREDLLLLLRGIDLGQSVVKIKDAVFKCLEEMFGDQKTEINFIFNFVYSMETNRGTITY